MSFTNFKKRFQENFNNLIDKADRLYTVDVDPDEMWNLYLDSFPNGTNNIFRKRREHDCSACRGFIKHAGNIVVIKNNELYTIWDFETESPTYQPVVNALRDYVLSKTINNVFISKFKNIGTDFNMELLEDMSSITWHHLSIELPNRLVNRSSNSISEIQGSLRDIRNVFKRSLDEIELEAVNTILELISSNSLYRGEEWKNILTSFKKYKIEYDKLDDYHKELYAWEKSSEAGTAIGKIRNHSIGVLLVDISNNEDLDVAVRRYENIVAPANYKRPKAIFTKKMLEDAQKTITELGYMESLGRRYATLDDITVNNILFSNKDAQKRVQGATNVFEEMMSSIKAAPKKFDRVEEISIDKFIKDILPNVNSVEAYVENKHEPNFCSLIAPKNKDSKSMFKWNNNFSWAYNGNLTDANIKENVKNAGGKVDGVLRFSIQWNECGTDNSDLDAHCYEPNNSHIFFGTYKKPERSNNGGQLDVDIINPGGRIAVENIAWNNKNKMKPGIYKMFVHQYSGHLNSGFRAEIEFDGQIYRYNYEQATRTGQDIDIAEVILDNNGNFKIYKEYIPSAFSDRNIWNIKTNSFVPVSVVMYSPNYWDNQNGIGNRHYMFMLKDCINENTPNGFYNEFIKSELIQHKRVFEALGSKMSVEDSNDQLSGLGFSSTQRNELVVKVTGNIERVMKIKF